MNVYTWDPSAKNASATKVNPYVTTALLDLPETTLPIITEIWKSRSFFAGLPKRPKTLRSVVEGAAFSNGSEKTVPSSVLLELPETVFAQDLRTGGGFVAAMTSQLAELHQRDLADRMPKGTQARYQVTAAPGLSTHQMRVRLGPAIYVPEPNETCAWRVELSLDGTDWESLAPVKIFEGQRLFILSGSVNHGSQVCANWPFDAHVGLVMLNQLGQDKLDLSAEPLPSLEVVDYPKMGWMVVRKPGADTDSACLYVKTTRLQTTQRPAVDKQVTSAPLPVPQSPSRKLDHARTHVEPVLGAVPSVPAKPEPAPVGDDAPTIYQDRKSPPNIDDSPTFVARTPRRTARMTLRGLAVQRLSRYASEGVQGLQWALDARGQLVRADEPQALHRFELTPNDELRLLTRNGHRVLTLGESLPLQAGRATSVWQALPSALAAGYLGWLSLPDCTSAPLLQGQDLAVGRMHPALTTLRPLAQAGKVLAQPKEGADRLGLSRHHANLCLSQEGLLVKTVKDASVAHLDADMNFLGWIGHETGTVLETGQHLLLAHYLWCLEG